MPCFNEEAGLHSTLDTVSAKLLDLVARQAISEKSFMLLTDDGSQDATWSILSNAHRKDFHIRAIRLAANRGKEYALWAGVMEARLYADVVACMDADLQFNIHALDLFLQKQAEGYDLIYGIKRNRGQERWYKAFAARMFYALMQKLGSPILRNHTDFCLMNRQVCNALSEYGETNLIFRGLLRSLGFRQCAVPFDVNDRAAGQSHFSARKLINLSLDAITSFSIAPLRLIGGLGFLIFLTGLGMIAWTIADALRGITPSGYATLTCSLWFLGGLGMLCLSIVGEYLGKLYMEAKKRPRFFIREKLM